MFLISFNEEAPVDIIVCFFDWAASFNVGKKLISPLAILIKPNFFATNLT